MPARNPAIILLSIVTLAQSGLWFLGNSGDAGLRDGFLSRAGFSGPERAHQAVRLMMLSGDGQARRDATSLQTRLLLLNAASPYEWMKTGVQLRAAGESQAADYAIRRGVQLAPSSAPAAMEAVHYYVLAGNRDQVLATGKRVQAMVHSYDDFLLRYYEELGASTADILDRGVNHNTESMYAFLTHSMEGRRLNQARQIWARMTAGNLRSADALNYFTQYLIQEKQPAEAWAEWRSYYQASRPEADWSQGVFNPGFELPPVEGAFDWHWGDVAGADASISSEDPQQGRYCLKVAFSGETNVNYAHAGQSVVAGPGRYELAAFVKSQGITTNQGVAIEVTGGGGLNAATEPLTGTTAWKRVTAEIHLPRPCLLNLRVMRHPSAKFDNKIAGTFWMDNVSLRRVN